MQKQVLETVSLKNKNAKYTTAQQQQQKYNVSWVITQLSIKHIKRKKITDKSDVFRNSLPHKLQIHAVFTGTNILLMTVVLLLIHNMISKSHFYLVVHGGWANRSRTRIVSDGKHNLESRENSPQVS